MTSQILDFRKSVSHLSKVSLKWRIVPGVVGNLKKVLRRARMGRRGGSAVRGSSARIARSVISGLVPIGKVSRGPMGILNL